MTTKTNKECRQLLAACAVTATGMMITSGVVLCPLTHAAPKQEATPKPEAAKKAPAEQFPQFALDVTNTSLVYTVTLNGWVVDTSPGNANAHFTSTRVGEYIADGGDNVVSVHLSAPDPKFFSNFALGLRTTGHPQLFEYEWDASVPHPHPLLPVQEERCFTARLPTGPWAWQTAPRSRCVKKEHKSLKEDG